MNIRITNFLSSIYPLSLVLFAFSIPINYRISLYALGLFTLIGFALVVGRQSINHLFKSKILIGLALFWILHSLSLLYTENLQYGLFDIFQKISLLIIPFAFLPDIIKKEDYRYIKKAFLWGLVVSSLFFLARALVLSTIITPVGVFFRSSPLGRPWENYFFYDLFVKPHHPTYYSMYLTLGIIFLLDDIKDKAVIKARLPLYSLIFYFTGIIYLTSSKAGILTTLLVLIISNFWLLKSKGKLLLSVFLLVSVAISLFILKGNNRFASTIKNLQRFTSQTELNDELLLMDLSRFEVWKAVPKVFKGFEWIYGVGVGDTKERLKDAYKAENAIYAFSKELNAHNQFLQTLVGIGLIGLIILLSILGYSFYIATTRKDIVLGLFLILISVNFMFEAVLERVFGVIFFTFVLVLLSTKKS